MRSKGTAESGEFAHAAFSFQPYFFKIAPKIPVEWV